MDIKRFYFDNVKRDDYHYRYYDEIIDVNYVDDLWDNEFQVDDFGFEVFDEEEAITKFKELCQPEVSFVPEKWTWFHLLCFFLHKSGYEISDFPRILARPPYDPQDFVYKDIRNRLISMGLDDNGTVRYQTRRIYVAKMVIRKSNDSISIPVDLDKKFEEISTRSASFSSMTDDEKLQEIANLIECLLKQNGKFITPDYSSVCGVFLEDSDITAYRKKLQCFRHSSNESLVERKNLTQEQKHFLIDYGITIVKVIHTLVNGNKTTI